MLCHEKTTIDVIAKKFRQSIEPEVCYEACQHCLLLIKDMNNAKETVYAYHIHGKMNTTERTYERFSVDMDQVRDLKFIGCTNYSPKEIESICEWNLGLKDFSESLTCCYEWPRAVTVNLHNTKSNNQYKYALYTGSLSSYSQMNASSQFVAGSYY
jgi:hypothetical protein